jgi:hypothetical protein
LSSDPQITTADTRLGAPSIAAIPTGQSITNGVTVYIPNSIVAGSYYETDESNNVRTGNVIDITVGADLTVRSVTGPTTVNLSATFSVTNSIRNIGAGDSATNSRVGIYVSTDAVISTNDVLVGFRNLNSILTGTTNTGGNVVTLPASITAGSYYLGAVVDYQNAVREVLEDNNALMGYQLLVGVTPFRISGLRVDGVDLLITFETQNGQNYTVQESQSIGDTVNWQPVAGASSIAGTGSTIEFRHAGGATTSTRFYRILQAQ